MGTNLKPMFTETEKRDELVQPVTSEESANGTSEIAPLPSNGQRSDVKRSISLGKLAQALAKAQLEFEPIYKDTENPYYRSRYAELSSIIAATQKALAKNGLVIIQMPFVDVEKQKSGVTSLMVHTSGEWISNDLILPAIMLGRDGKPRFDSQSAGSAQTYSRRYAYQALIGVAAEPDDDANSSIGSKESAAQAIAAAKIADLEKKLAPPPEPQSETNGEPPVLFSLQIWPDIFEISGHSDVMEAHKNLLLLYGKKVVIGRGEARKATVHMSGEKLANFTFEFEKRGGKVKALKPAETNANS